MEAKARELGSGECGVPLLVERPRPVWIDTYWTPCRYIILLTDGLPTQGDKRPRRKAGNGL
jgi:hypothetical protein